MSLLIPFDNNPVDNKETTTSYTVPAGKYAIVTVSLSVSAFSTVKESGVAGALLNSHEGKQTQSVTNSHSVTLRLKTGEVVTKTETGGTSNYTSTSTFTGWVTHQATAVAAVLVNSTEVAQIQCGAFGKAWDGSGTSGANVSIDIVRTADVHWHIAEYNNIS